MTAARDFRQAPTRLTDRLTAAMRGRAAVPPLAVQPSLQTDDVRLRIVRGRHQGAEAELSAGRIAIGGSLDGDIVLTDSGVMAEHLVVDLVGKPGARSLTLSAVAPGVMIAGEELAVGAPKRFDMPVTVDLAGAGLEFIDPVPRVVRRSAGKAMVVLPLAVAAGIGTAALGSWWLQPSAAPMLPRAGMPGPFAGVVPAPRLNVAPLAEASRLMERQLVAAGLDKQIKVSQRDNVLVAEGTLAIDAHPKWRDIKAAVRASVSERLLIADMVRPLESGDNGMRAMIASVTGGKSPAVIGVNGKRAAVGETLIDGWVVKQIASDAVHLERGGARVTVKLSP